MLKRDFIEKNIGRPEVSLKQHPCDFPTNNGCRKRNMDPPQYWNKKGRQKGNKVDWTLCVRVDSRIPWTEIEEMLSTALLREKPTRITPFALNRAIFFGDDVAEPTWLDSHGSKMIRPVPLFFHRWHPVLGTKNLISLHKGSWVRLRGIPFHLRMKDIFETIGKACGGLRKIDRKSLDKSELRWARILLRLMAMMKIPRCMKITDGETSYQVVILMKKDWEEGDPILDKPLATESRNHRNLTTGEVGAEVAAIRSDKALILAGKSETSNIESTSFLAQGVMWDLPNIHLLVKA